MEMQTLKEIAILNAWLKSELSNSMVDLWNNVILNWNTWTIYWWIILWLIKSFYNSSLYYPLKY